jgi:hypothetical protein
MISLTFQRLRPTFAVYLLPLLMQEQTYTGLPSVPFGIIP